jgi:hypothetical protein
MATDSAVTPSDPSAVAPPGESQRLQNITIYSHSNLMYWWPVWLVCFIMAGVTYAGGNQMAVVPDGTVAVSGATVAHPDREFPGPRDVLVAPKGQHFALAPTNDGTKAPAGADPTEAKNRKAERASMTVSGSNGLGVIFAMTIFVVAIVSTLLLRGLLSVIALLLMIGTVITLALFGLWDDIFHFVGGLDIRMNAAGYLCIGIPLFLVWAFVFFVQDRMMFMTFDEGQIRYVMEIGDSAVVMPSEGVMVEKKRSDVFRHWLLGFGTGDLVVRAPNGREIELPNITNADRKMAIINDFLRHKAIVVSGDSVTVTPRAGA